MQHQLPEWSGNQITPIYVRALNMYRNSRKHGERSLTKDLRRITISVNNDGYRETYRIVSNDLIECS